MCVRDVAARKLYESYGFILVAEAIGNKWGKDMLVQHLVRSLGGMAISQKS